MGVPLGRGYIYVLTRRIFMYFFRRHAIFYQNVPLHDQNTTKKNVFYTGTIDETIVLNISSYKV